MVRLLSCQILRGCQIDTADYLREKILGGAHYLIAQTTQPANLHHVKRESGGEADLYGGGPIQKRETNTHKPTPAGTKTGDCISMKYAHVYSEIGDWDGATPIWVLEIGRDVIGLASHGSAIRVGVFSTAAAAVLAATERGVSPEKVEVGE